MIIKKGNYYYFLKWIKMPKKSKKWRKKAKKDSKVTQKRQKMAKIMSNHFRHYSLLIIKLSIIN